MNNMGVAKSESSREYHLFMAFAVHKELIFPLETTLFQYPLQLSRNNHGLLIRKATRIIIDFP